MGNKRQRLARKAFRAITEGSDVVTEGGDVREKEQTNVKNGSEIAEKVKAKDRRKREALELVEIDEEINSREVLAPEESDLSGTVAAADKTSSGQKNETHERDEKTSKRPGSKHPFRMPGMKPGEGCFLCKSTDHIAKLCPTKSARDRKKICLQCRAIGHTLKNCPNSFKTQEIKFCYNCGENGHRLAECQKPIKDGGTGFADCFVCKQKGHLSKNCPRNPHGIYPKGGCCKFCGAVEHLAKDCSTKNSRGHIKLQISTGKEQASENGGYGKHTVFKSGDDLDDDFVEDDVDGNIFEALNFGSDDEARTEDLKRGTTKSNLGHPQKMNKKKSEKSMPVKMNTKLIASGRKQQVPKVVHFQRPKQAQH